MAVFFAIIWATEKQLAVHGFVITKIYELRIGAVKYEEIIKTKAATLNDIAIVFIDISLSNSEIMNPITEAIKASGQRAPPLLDITDLHREHFRALSSFAVRRCQIILKKGSVLTQYGHRFMLDTRKVITFVYCACAFSNSSNWWFSALNLLSKQAFLTWKNPS